MDDMVMDDFENIEIEDSCPHCGAPIDGCIETELGVWHCPKCDRDVDEPEFSEEPSEVSEEDDLELSDEEWDSLSDEDLDEVEEYVDGDFREGYFDKRIAAAEGSEDEEVSLTEGIDDLEITDDSFVDEWIDRLIEAGLNKSDTLTLLDYYHEHPEEIAEEYPRPELLVDQYGAVRANLEAYPEDSFSEFIDSSGEEDFTDKKVFDMGLEDEEEWDDDLTESISRQPQK